MRQRRAGRTKEGGKEKKGITGEKAKKINIPSLSTRTASDLEMELNKRNIPLIDIRDLFNEIEDNESEFDAPEDIDGFDADDENSGFEDENVDYDEGGIEDPFDEEYDFKRRRGIYTAEVAYNDDVPSVSFLQIPIADTTNALFNGAIAERSRIFQVIAYFLSLKQKEFFKTATLNKIVNLNQLDLVRYLDTNGCKSAKAPVSRMLDSLFFVLPGMGRIPSRLLFKRYGHKTGLSKAERAELAEEFLKSCSDEVSQLEKAKRFWEYLRDQKGIQIKLASNDNDNDRFRNMKNIIRDAEKKLKNESAKD